MFGDVVGYVVRQPRSEMSDVLDVNISLIGQKQSWVVVIYVLFRFISRQMVESFSRLFVLADSQTVNDVIDFNLLPYWSRKAKSAFFVECSLSQCSTVVRNTVVRAVQK